MEFLIKGNLPTLNEYIKEAKASKYRANALKQRADRLIVVQLLQQKKHVPDTPHDVVFTWVRNNNRFDLDNIEFAVKFIFDAFQKAGILKNDGVKQVQDKMHIHVLDKQAKTRSVFVEFVQKGKLKSFYK